MTPISTADLGIETDNPSGHGVYRWLLASFLIGKRIRSSVAIEAYRNLVDRYGLDTPAKLARCPHRDLVRLLGQAGYARYDESTARRLHELGVGLDTELESRMNALQSGSMEVAEFEQWLLSFNGIGPKTLEIFKRGVVLGDK
ncbi:DNA methylase [Pseudomonas sp. B21-028]|uniref:DNA methylase n=1 Tax=Pseudomonas sp. B21-028 TaxID=2895480 RepID=UPI00216072AD|nr:DNA methylase [Pseudomonas sp. B21-028]UVL81384.1 DNA methylase [Pseudomonas sp. B21-028]